MTYVDNVFAVVPLINFMIFTHWPNKIQTLPLYQRKVRAKRGVLSTRFVYCPTRRYLWLYQASRHFSIRHQASSHFFPQRLELGIELAASLMSDRKWWLAWIQRYLFVSKYVQFGQNTTKGVRSKSEKLEMKIFRIFGDFFRFVFFEWNFTKKTQLKKNCQKFENFSFPIFHF